MKSQAIAALFFLNTFLYMVSCKPAHNENEIVAQMARYDRLLEKMNTDSIADLYTDDGQLGNAARGRDSISRFLKKFSDYRVLSNRSATDSVRMFADSAIQYGKYTQTTILPGKDTAHLKGLFKAVWKLTDRNWKIEKMETESGKD